jgi:hypothetical protein
MELRQTKTLPALLLAVVAAACGGGGSGGGPSTYDVTVTKVGTGTGTVSGSGISCGSSCSKTVDSGANMTLTATAAATSLFAGWGGACAAATRNKCTLSAIAADQAVTATFTLVNNLTITKVGAGSGTISQDPAGVACGFGCTAYEPTVTVTLSVSAHPDSTFTGWSGACTGTDTTCTVAMSAAQTVTASFDFDSASTTCWLPSTPAWTSTDPIAEPAAGWVALKDFTTAPYNGQHLVYMSTHDDSTHYGSAWMAFDDWPDAATATQTATSFNAVAPTLLYFTPTDQWILAYQWGATNFSYRTSDGLDAPLVWSAEQPLYNSGAPGTPTAQWGPIDQTLICDDTDCYLFFAGDNGVIYRSSMPIGSFPGVFGAATNIMTEPTNDLFEAVQVYSVQGTGEYLMIVEAIGGANRRYFRAFTATDLAGEWTPISGLESQPFAGLQNVTFTGTEWTPSISHGDLVRSGASEKMPIDACNLQLLYQGSAGTSSTYDLIPWRPGLLTLTRD